jgi:hypothetical protein
MSNTGFYSFSYTLTKNNETVPIPVTLQFTVRKIKIRTLSYTTADNNLSYFILVNIKNFVSNSVYVANGVGGSTSLAPYQLYVPLNAQQSSQNIYLNRLENSWDVELEEGRGLANLNIECLINGTYSSLISPSNPVFIEILLQS